MISRRAQRDNDFMTQFQKATLAFLSVLACFLFGLVVWLWRGEWQQPLGPPLQISTATPFQLPPTWTPNPNETATPHDALNAVSILSASPTLPSTLPATGMCGAPPRMNILV